MILACQPASAALPLAVVPVRVAIGIDGADTSGVAVWRVGDASGLVCSRVVRMRAAGASEAARVELLDELVGTAEWIAAIERPFGRRRDGRGTPPSYAVAAWAATIDALARLRARRLGVAFRRPQIMRPYPQVWRTTLGVRTAGDVKAASLAYAREVLGVGVEDHNEAEAVLIACFAARLARTGATSAKLFGARLGRAKEIKFVP